MHRLAFLSLVILAACHKPRPSPEYIEAEGLYTRLSANSGDDAFVDPEMSVVESLLAAVPGDSTDSAAARALAAKILRERQRVLEQQAAYAKLLAEARTPAAPNFPARHEQPAPLPAPAAPAGLSRDAGLGQPVRGMSLAEFNRQFSGCFTESNSIEVAGQGAMGSFALKDIANCRDRYPEYKDVFVLIREGKVYDRIPAAAVHVEFRLADGGR